MSRRPSTLGYEHTLMYGRYKEDLGQFAKSQAQRISPARSVKSTVTVVTDEDDEEGGDYEDRRGSSVPKFGQSTWLFITHWTDYVAVIWNMTFARIGEDWIFLAMLGIIMALLSYIMDRVIYYCTKTRLFLFESSGDHLAMQYFAWTTTSISLILFATGFVHLVAPQAIGSGIPEIKTILRGVVLKEYLTFKTLVAKMVGLTFTLGSGMPLGKEGPFVHIASIVATLLSKLITSFKGIYENESRAGEMLSAAAAIGVASTFYSPIGGVLFSIEVTSVYFAVRNYWRGFFAACCGATVWRLLGVWIHAKEMTITALFKTNFRTDFPFSLIELFIFALIGVMCGFAGAGYVAFHRKIVHFNRSQKRMSDFLQKNRFLYPGIVTFIISTCSFPGFLGKYSASLVNTHDQIDDLFSNKTWGIMDRSEGGIASRWTTDHSSVFFHLAFFIFMLWWTSALASTMPVPSGLFIPVFKMGAAFGRLVGEVMAFIFPSGISFFGSHTNPIVPGGYAVVGAAAFGGAVTHTISTTVIVFELTGQLSHIIPCIIAVLISNAIAQNLESNIYDSIIQIKKLPFLPNISSTSTTAHEIVAGHIMVRDVIFVWFKCTYRDIKKIIKEHRQIQSFPVVDSPDSMILLGSIQRQELQLAISRHLGRERRLQEVQRRKVVEDVVRVEEISREEFLSRNRGAFISRSGTSNGSKEPLPSSATSIPPFSHIPPPTIVVNDETEMGETSESERKGEETSESERKGENTNQKGESSNQREGNTSRKEEGKENGSGDSKASSGGPGVTGTRRLSRFEITPVASQGGKSNVVPESQKTQLVEVDWKGNEGRGRKDASSSSDPNSIERRQKLEQSHFILPGFPVKSILKSSSPTSNAYGYPASHSSATVTYDSRLKQAFDNLFTKGLKVQENRPSSDIRSAPCSPSSGRRVQLPRERIIDMSPEEQMIWENEQLDCEVDFSRLKIDPAPFQLVEQTSLIKVHSLFSMLQLNHTYVTSIGKLVGVVSIKDIRVALEKVHAGEFFPVKEEGDEDLTTEEEQMMKRKYSINNNNAVKRSSIVPSDNALADAINTASAVLLPLKPSSSTSSVSHEVSIHETSDTEVDDTEIEGKKDAERRQLKNDSDNHSV